MSGFIAPAMDFGAHAFSTPVAALCRRAPYLEGGSLPCFGGAGTGGFEGVILEKMRLGYRSYYLLDSEIITISASYAPYTDLMKEVKTGFGRTLSHLPAVFGVSRQTLYNWLSGEIPKEQHQEKLVQLAEAARVFVRMGFKPTALALDRTIAQGKSFVELLSEGADGKETAERLVRIAKRGATSREKLDALLGGRAPAKLDVSDIGRPSLNEAV